MLRGGGLGGVSQLKPAICAIGRYRGVSQLHCRKLRLDGPLRHRGIKNSASHPPSPCFIFFKGGGNSGGED